MVRRVRSHLKLCVVPGCDPNLGGVSKDQTHMLGGEVMGRNPQFLDLRRGSWVAHLYAPRCTRFAIRRRPGKTRPYPEWTEPGIMHVAGVLKGEASVALTEHFFSRKMGKKSGNTLMGISLASAGCMWSCIKGPTDRLFFLNQQTSFFLLQMDFIYRPTISNQQVAQVCLCRRPAVVRHCEKHRCAMSSNLRIMFTSQTGKRRSKNFSHWIPGHPAKEWQTGDRTEVGRVGLEGVWLKTVGRLGPLCPSHPFPSSQEPLRPQGGQGTVQPSSRGRKN